MNIFYLRSFGFVLAFFGIFSLSFGQRKVVENVFDVEFRNSGVIAEGNTIKGYYFFYKTDDASSKTNIYEIKFLDANFNDIGMQEIKGSKSLFLREASYNGEAILLRLIDYNTKQITTYLFGNDGKQISKKVQTATLFELKGKEKGDADVESLSLMGVPNKGFVSYMTGDKETNSKINFMPSNKKSRAWGLSVSSQDYKYSMVTPLTVHGDFVVTSVGRKKNLMRKDIDYSILAANVNTGKKVFEQKFQNKDYTIYPMNAYSMSANELCVLGLYYSADAKILKEASLGLFSAVLDNKGKIISEKFISWENDVSAFVEINAKGKIKDLGYLFFHNITRTSDGKIFAVAESYRKAADAGGIAMNLLTLGRTSASTAQVIIEDLLIFEFSPDFKLQNVHIFDKTKTNVDLPSGALYMGVQVLGLVTKYYGDFDYSFTQENPNSKTFTVCYQNYEKGKNDKGKWVFGAITYVGDKFVQDKISIETEASSLSIRPAKPGFMAVMEYYKKKQSLELRLEKINY